jgi:hypothetical protein
VFAPEGVTYKPSPSDEEGAIDRFAAYVLALEKRDFAAAYAMLRLSYQASNPRLEWEMNQRKRVTLWADGQIRPLRLSWYLDPAGQPAGLYAAFDFRGDRKDGTNGLRLCRRSPRDAGRWLDRGAHRHVGGSGRVDRGWRTQGDVQGRSVAPTALLSGQGDSDQFLTVCADDGPRH